MRGYWVFGWGGLFDGHAVQPVLFHIVNIEGQGGGTLCGLSRFKSDDPGGSWRSKAAEYVERGDALVGSGGGNPQVCPRCSDRLLDLVADTQLPFGGMPVVKEINERP